VEGLRKRHVIVDVVPVYQTLPVENLAPPPPFDAATFMSPSALSAFVAGPGGAAALAKAVVAVIGPTTASRAAELGIRVDATAARPGAREIADALVSFYQGRPR